MLYRRTIRTTVPQRIRNKDPHANLDMEQLNNRAAQSTSYHDCHSQIKSPFYAGQTVSVLNDATTLWLPATILWQADHGSYLIKVVGGGTYRRAHDHILARHPDAVKKQPHTGNLFTWQCSPCYARVAWSPSSTLTASSDVHCTCCTHNSTTACCSHSKDQHSMQSCCSHTCAPNSLIHWSSTTADWSSPCCPTPICPHP